MLHEFTIGMSLNGGGAGAGLKASQENVGGARAGDTEQLLARGELPSCLAIRDCVKPMDGS